jgi:hypothetical protein
MVSIHRVSHSLSSTGHARTPGARRVAAMPARATLLFLGFFLVAFVAESCDHAISDPARPVADSSVITTVILKGPAAVLVHESSLLTVSARDATGRDVSGLANHVFSSSDPSVLEVNGFGAVRGVRRGTATITVRVGTVSAETRINVRARVKILPQPPSQPDGFLPMGIRDTLQLSAVYADVDGITIVETPIVSWRSNHPGIATVTADGRVVALTIGYAQIVAEAPDGMTSAAVRVERGDSIPATMRLAHAVKGVGPIKFIANQNDTVTLTYGQSVERTITAGLFRVTTEGMPGGAQFDSFKSYSDLVRGGDVVTIYAAGGPAGALVTATWRTDEAVPADSSHVRLVQGWTAYQVVYVRSPGTSASGIPEQCYFDVGYVSEYYSRPPGPLNIILQEKLGGSTNEARLVADAPAGRAVTIVLTGSSRADIGYLLFVDR